ncbi:MAG: hypothetical protein CMI21_04700 [Opitutae bacterium]|nr:hypothetical protein [Opitutae bacterium]
MFKLSKEAKRTFVALFLVPLAWIALNQFGFLDFLEYKSVDLRFKMRGNVSHQEGSLASERIEVEGNKTVPRIPKVIYVNFDADTLSMDEVGERPWNRDFFRNVGRVLLTEGKARVVGYDFIFSPKSTSSMVPEENVYDSDSKIAELVEEFPGQVILASAFTNVQTPFLKNSYVNFLSGPPNLNEGYDQSKMGFRYPESPTYPIFSYKDGQYLGINGPITVAPNKVDGMQRVASLWFPGGGRAHAYNVLGGKMAKLALENIESNKSSGPTLVEIGKELQLVWMESNNTLIDTTPNRMPLVRDRNFHAFGVEALLAYYGLDEKSVEITEGNTRLVIRSLSGDLLVDTPLIEQQGMEINWFSNWKEEAEAETLYMRAKEHYNQEQYSEYAAIGPKVIRLFLERVEGIELSAEDSKLVATLQELGFDKVLLKTAEELMQAAQGKIDPENAPDIIRLEKLLAKIADNYLPPGLLSEYNPMCGMDNVLYNDKLRKAVETILKLEAALHKYRIQHYKYSDHNESLNLWAEIQKLGPGQSPEKASLLSELGEMEEGQSLFKESSVEVTSDSQADSIGVELVALNQKLMAFQAVKGLKSKILKLEKLQKRKLEIKEEIETLRKRAEEFPVAAAGIKAIIPGKEKELGDLDAEIAKLEDVSKSKLQEQKLAIEREVEELKKRIEQFPALAAVIQNSQIGPKEKQIKEKEEEIARLDEIAEGGAEGDLDEEQAARVTAQAMSTIKSLISYNRKEISDSDIENKPYISFFEQFKDAIVLVGPTEATFQDLSPTPTDPDPVPKVSVHGNIIKTLSSGIYLERILHDRSSVALLIFTVCLVLGFLSVLSAPWSNWVGVLTMLAFVGVAFFLFTRHHLVMPLAAPSLAGISTFFIGLIVMMVIEQKAKGRLKGMFGSYVSADLVEQMVESGEEPHLGGEETAITAFFSDVQAFSSFSELLTPTGLVDLMNEYLTAMTDILQEERGTLDKYIGDAIVAMYGAPIPMEDHAYQSVRTALLMQEKQLELRDKWALEEEKWGKCYGLVKQMQTRIGCNTGTATVGNMGALDRFNYTMMGDMVNLAARCESGAKAYGAYIMITEETKIASEQTKDDIAFRYLDKIVVKGRSQPVAMYEPTGFMADLGQETQDCLDCFRQGIDKYLAQDWDGALKMFEKAKEMEPNKPGVTPGVKDNPSMILIDRCQVMKENPPGDDWDGVYVMTSK